jgi:hypothetical protein
MKVTRRTLPEHRCTGVVTPVGHRAVRWWQHVGCHASSCTAATINLRDCGPTLLLKTPLSVIPDWIASHDREVVNTLNSYAKCHFRFNGSGDLKAPPEDCSNLSRTTTCAASLKQDATAHERMSESPSMRSATEIACTVHIIDETEDFGVPSKLKWHIFDPATELPNVSV